MVSTNSMVKACVGLVIANCFLIMAIVIDIKFVKLVAIAYLIEQSLNHIAHTRKYIERSR